MQVNIVKLSDWRIPRKFLGQWLKALEKELKKQISLDLNAKELTLVFVDAPKILELNRTYRAKAKVTDVLSFSGLGEDSLGELIFCGSRINEQALDHKLSKKQELGYLVIHGVLHLLGYEHEQGGRKEKEMFTLQDKLFDKLWSKFF